MTTTTAEMQLKMEIEAAEQFMKKAPYLGYDHAKNLIEAARLVLEERGGNNAQCNDFHSAEMV